MSKFGLTGGTMRLIFLSSLLVLIVSSFAITSNAESGIQYSEPDTATVKEDYPYILPIWGQKVTDRNIQLPLPLGFNVNYIYNQMSLELTHFSMNFYDGENLDDIINAETLNFTETVAIANGVNLRTDAWIFPFLNLYGMYSRNKGSTQVSFQPQVIETGLGINGNLVEITTLEEAIEVDPVSFSTNTYGVGSTAVYGLDNFFISVDGNITWSTSDLLEQTVKFVVGSARVGKRTDIGKGMKFAVYIGAMYRDFIDKENNTGSLGVPEFDEAMAQAVDTFLDINQTRIDFWEGMPDGTPGKDENLEELHERNDELEYSKDRIENSDSINYSIKKEIINNWSTQIGFNLEFSEQWMLRGEYGYREGQKFFMSGVQFRFGL